MLTQVLVDPDDPAFTAPTKPIGPVYSEQEARELAADRGWTIARDGDHFRRVVASPEPKGIVELAAIERLVDAGSVVICAGGGGIPVFDDSDGLHGVEAVIDKDLTAALLAEELGADRLIVLTDVPYVERDWGTPDATPIAAATPPSCARSRSPPARWARRSRPPAASSSERAAKPSSAPSRSSALVHAARPARASLPPAALAVRVVPQRTRCGRLRMAAGALAIYRRRR